MSSSSSTTTTTSTASNGGGGSGTQGCAACKYLQRGKCTSNCIFSPYFPAENPRRFLNAHRLFGVSNIEKIIRNLDPAHRYAAMSSIKDQADAWAREGPHTPLESKARRRLTYATLRSIVSSSSTTTTTTSTGSNGSGGGGGSGTQACGACKWQRRKCPSKCSFARYFATESVRQFLSARRLFGICNILKIMQIQNPAQRSVAMSLIKDQANAWAREATDAPLDSLAQRRLTDATLLYAVNSTLPPPPPPTPPAHDLRPRKLPRRPQSHIDNDLRNTGAECRKMIHMADLDPSLVR